MKLKVVGCGDAFGSGGRGHSCYCVTSGATTATLDFGASALVNFNRFNMGSADIDFIFLSHLHGDHFGGIPFLLLDGQFARLRSRALTIVGPPGARARIEAAQEVLFPGTLAFDWRFPWRVEEVAPGSTSRHGPFTLTTTEVRHPSGAPSTALRLTDGARTLAFSGDTEWTEALPQLTRGADLLICESFAWAGMPYGHLSYETLSARREELGAGRVLLTHMGDEMWAHRAEVDTARFIVAEDGMELDV